MLAACGGATKRASTTSTTREPLYPSTEPAPWAAPISARKWILAANLPALPSERFNYHVHAHLDVLVDGAAKPVAAGIGIDNVTKIISPLHTHDTTGLIHIESDVERDFTVGQFFTEWGVRLTDQCVGAYCAPDKAPHWYVNGNEQTGDPNAIVIHPHDEIALAVGQPPEPIPSSYSYPEGY